MTPRVGLAIVLGVVLASSCASSGAGKPNSGLWTPDSGRRRLAKDFDAILSAPVLSRALVGVRIESLRTGRLLYARNSDKLVVPASNLKLFTLAVAAERLGWDHRFETRLEATGTIADGVLTGDLVVVGGGDPTIVSPDLGHPALFLEWAKALQAAGIHRVDGRIIGDDNAFDDQGLGAGWAWDYLADGYAAPSGALSYHNNVVSLRLTPGRAAGEAAAIELAPAGAVLVVDNQLTTREAGSAPGVSVGRLPGSTRLIVSGSVPAGGAPIVRQTTVENPTRYFVEALLQALASRGIPIRQGAWDADDLTQPPNGDLRRLIARRESEPLSSLGAQMLKVSQNFYGEMLLKAIGRTTDRPGSAEAGRDVVRDTVGAWGISADSIVIRDGSGLSRYDYVTADAVVSLLKHVWHDERLRGPFVASLPVGAHDGTLENRMRNTALDRRVQAKTGTISNMRSLSGFLETNSGERIVFSIIVNHFTAGNADIDAVAERLLLRLVER